MSDTPRLSPRMEELCRLVAEGRPYKRAALAMGISVHTARSYAEEIGYRLGKRPRDAMLEYYFTVMRPRAGSDPSTRE